MRDVRCVLSAGSQLEALLEASKPAVGLKVRQQRLLLGGRTGSHQKKRAPRPLGSLGRLASVGWGLMHASFF